jgi:hypothetical protein
MPISRRPGEPADARAVRIRYTGQWHSAATVETNGDVGPIKVLGKEKTLLTAFGRLAVFEK